jgi:hypothetical protein
LVAAEATGRAEACSVVAGNIYRMGTVTMVKLVWAAAFLLTIDFRSPLRKVEPVSLADKLVIPAAKIPVAPNAKRAAAVSCLRRYAT